MCELFAINARTRIPANSYLREFYSHSNQHPHGWGIACNENGAVKLHKEPVKACDSSFLHKLLEQPIAHRRLIGHIRLATIGVTRQENCHPFKVEDSDGNIWMMAHNGTIFNDALLTGYGRQSNGDTDSEQVVLFLMDLLDAAEMRHGGELSFEGRFAALNSAITKLSNGNKVNIVLDDGEYLYVHTNTMTKTLYVKQEPDIAVFSTQPLDDDPAWQPVPTAQLQAYRDGQLVRQAPAHANIFVECAIENYLLIRTPPSHRLPA